MKNNIIRIFGKLILVFGLYFFPVSCDEEFLDEIPKDFLTPNNAYTNLDGFETAINGLHYLVREHFWNGNWKQYALFGNHTDYTFSYNKLDYNALSASGIWAGFLVYWDSAYKLIQNANTIISHAEMDEAKWNSNTDKLQIIAEAKFFRAWGHKILANLFGGVPIVDTEIISPKYDYVRNTRDEVYQFCKEDLEYAVVNLPDEEKSPGRITKAAANHLLSEINICLENWQEAIDAASLVIDDPDYELMAERFGARTDIEGDVYWDLFQIGNQNRNSGNKESIWVIQEEYGATGGGNGCLWEWMWGPWLTSIKDPDGNSGFITDDEFGWPIAHRTPTYWLQQVVWEDDWDDMRNSSYNIRREFYYNNPKSNYYGQKVTKEVLIPMSNNYRYCQVYYMKATTPWDHPKGIYNTGIVWKDIYAMRLAETYLLRAEAYLGKGDKQKAADDINVVRARANATPVDADDVDIDFILDERARELAVEEMRSCTLMRLGLLYDRVKKYSYILWADGSVEATKENTTIQPHNNLWPIPQTAIDLNSEATLEQNPGY